MQDTQSISAAPSLIAEHLIARQVILQCGIKSELVCMYVYIYIYIVYLCL